MLLLKWLLFHIKGQPDSSHNRVMEFRDKGLKYSRFPGRGRSFLKEK